MASRVLSATVGVPLVLAAVWAGLPWLSFLTAALAYLGALEFYRMSEQRGARPAVLPGIGWLLLFIVGGHVGGLVTLWALLGGAAATLSWHQLRRLGILSKLARAEGERRGIRAALVDWTYTAAGAVYMGWTLSLALALRQKANGLEWVLLVVLGAFATDTGAFFTGRALGRRPLAPRISPGKTWEGAVGGFVIGTGVVMGLASGLSLPITLWEGAILGALVAVAAQAGDLVESRLKRAAGVKDAGNLIPGHGGILDRLDSVVFVLVVVYHFFVWVAK